MSNVTENYFVFIFRSDIKSLYSLRYSLEGCHVFIKSHEVNALALKSHLDPMGIPVTIYSDTRAFLQVSHNFLNNLKIDAIRNS
jgi:hypothetical protein